jgi:hypothetical protein
VDWPNFFRGIYYSYLPKPYWRSWRPSSTVDFAQSTVVSGLLECAVALVLLAAAFWHFLLVRAHQLRPAAETNAGTQLYLLAILSVEYVFHPLSLVGLYFAGEGALRAWAAYFTDEILPSVPFRLAALLQSRRADKKRRAALGPALPDLVEQIGDTGADMRIFCQTPKEGWRPSITVAVEDEFYEVATVENNSGPRPTTYVLRKLPPGHVMRGMYRYDPPARQKD